MIGSCSLFLVCPSHYMALTPKRWERVGDALKRFLITDWPQMAQITQIKGCFLRSQHKSVGIKYSRHSAGASAQCHCLCLRQADRRACGLAGWMSLTFGGMGAEGVRNKSLSRRPCQTHIDKPKKKHPRITGVFTLVVVRCRGGATAGPCWQGACLKDLRGQAKALAARAMRP
jgi:hypothetical protein